jgi:SAM-dependent methyltransferase
VVTEQGAFPVPFVCPACHGPLTGPAGEFACAPCVRRYPVVAGIPDFRLAPDPWISIDDDRAKGCRLESTTAGAGFEHTVRAYWAMTPGTPPDVAARFIDHVLSAAPRSREWLARVVADAPAPDGPWLDLGCGTADLAEAAPPGQTVVGIDVAFRWLVAARRRLHAAGRPAWLVCCNAEHLPFPPRVFGRVLSLGLLEHTSGPQPIFAEAARVLRPGGRVTTRSVNRFSLLREPHVGVWGVGFVPRTWADGYVRWRSGQRYLHHRPPSARELRRAVRGLPLADVVVRPARLLSPDRARLGPFAPLAGPYESLSRVSAGVAALRWVAPLLETTGRAT